MPSKRIRPARETTLRIRGGPMPRRMGLGPPPWQPINAGLAPIRRDRRSAAARTKLSEGWSPRKPSGARRPANRLAPIIGERDRHPYLSTNWPNIATWIPLRGGRRSASRSRAEPTLAVPRPLSRRQASRPCPVAWPRPRVRAGTLAGSPASTAPLCKRARASASCRSPQRRQRATVCGQDTRTESTSVCPWRKCGNSVTS